MLNVAQDQAAHIPSQRHLFDVPEDVAYFNCATSSPQLNEALRRIRNGAGEKSHPWTQNPQDFFDDADTIRVLAADIFGGDPDGYAIVPAASYGLSTAARAIEPRLREHDRILVIAEEFPSNVLPWRRTASETGAELVTVPRRRDGDWTQAIVDAIDGRTKIVAVSTCHWTNAAHIDLRPIAETVRRIGGILVVDATQSLGAMPFGMTEIEPDFLVAAGYKWLLCPYGFSLLYVAERWRDARPLEESWLARSNAADFAALVNYSDVYMPGARRFDVGEKCNPAILPGAIAALEQIKAWTVDAIAGSLDVVNARIASYLQRLGFEVLPQPQRCPHMFGAKPPQGYAGDLVNDLRARNIHISRRGSALRFAPHLFVNDDDLVRLFSALDDLMK